jgi:hypothetical protein
MRGIPEQGLAKTSHHLGWSENWLSLELPHRGQTVVDFNSVFSGAKKIRGHEFFGGK